MKFKDFIKQKKVIEGMPDPQKAKSLRKMAINNLKYIEKIKIEEENSSVVLSQSYESLRQIIEAIALTEGLKVYSHEAFVFYLLEKNEEGISYKFDRLRKLRNGVNYYGKPVSVPVAIKAVKDIKEIISVLKKKYLKQQLLKK